MELLDLSRGLPASVPSKECSDFLRVLFYRDPSAHETIGILGSGCVLIIFKVPNTSI